MEAKLKLGKKPATYDRRDLLLKNLEPQNHSPSHPKHFGHEKLVAAKSWRMLGNGPDDTVSPGFGGAGDCVFAGGDHETMLWTLEGGAPAKFTGANAIADYIAVTGYDPKAPLDADGENPTDNGTNVRDALNYRQKTGLIDAAGKRHKIGATAKKRSTSKSRCSSTTSSPPGLLPGPWSASFLAGHHSGLSTRSSSSLPQSGERRRVLSLPNDDPVHPVIRSRSWLTIIDLARLFRRAINGHGKVKR